MSSKAPVSLPRITITYCTQCKWLLRAAYYAQELLSTFGASIGEVALVPATGGIFTVTIAYRAAAAADGSDDIFEEVSGSQQPMQVVIWDRKKDGGFPETKILKQKVRDVVEPEKRLGHSDGPPSLKATSSGVEKVEQMEPGRMTDFDKVPSGKEDCEDCK